MNIDKVFNQCRGRAQAFKDLKNARDIYIGNMTKENFNKMYVAQLKYHAFKSQIYTHENTVELLGYLKNNNGFKTLLVTNYSIKTKLWVYKSKNGLPVLTLETSEL